MEEINSALAVIKKKGDEYGWTDTQKPRKKHEEKRNYVKKYDNYKKPYREGFKGKGENNRHQNKNFHKNKPEYKTEHKPLSKKLNTQLGEGIEVREDKPDRFKQDRRGKGSKPNYNGNKNNKGRFNKKEELKDFTAENTGNQEKLVEEHIQKEEPVEEKIPVEEPAILSSLKNDSEIVKEESEKPEEKIEEPKIEEPQEPRFTREEWISQWKSSLSKVSSGQFCVEGMKKEVQERVTPETQSYSEKRPESHPEQGYPMYNPGYHPQYPMGYPPQYEQYPSQPQVVYYPMMPGQMPNADKDKQPQFAYAYPQYTPMQPGMAEMDPKKMHYMPTQPGYGAHFYQGK